MNCEAPDCFCNSGATEHTAAAAEPRMSARRTSARRTRLCPQDCLCEINDSTCGNYRTIMFNYPIIMIIIHIMTIIDLKKFAKLYGIRACELIVTPEEVPDYRKIFSAPGGDIDFTIILFKLSNLEEIYTLNQNQKKCIDFIMILFAMQYAPPKVLERIEFREYMLRLVQKQHKFESLGKWFSLYGIKNNLETEGSETCFQWMKFLCLYRSEP